MLHADILAWSNVSAMEHKNGYPGLSSFSQVQTNKTGMRFFVLGEDSYFITASAAPN